MVKFTRGIATWWLTATVIAAVPLYAWNGEVLSLPARAGPSLSGLTLDVDTRWVAGFGMRPVRLRLATAGKTPSPTDRTLTVELTVTEQYYDNWNLRERRQRGVGELLLPAGAATVEQTLSVPCYAPWRQVEIRVWEGNRELREFRAETYALNRTWGPVVGRSTLEASFPNLLVVDKDLPQANQIHSNVLFDVAQWTRSCSKVQANLLSLSNPYGGAAQTAGNVSSEAPRGIEAPYQHPGDAAVLAAVANDPSVMLLEPAQLPDRWIDLSCADVVVCSLDEIRLLAEQFPTKLEALRRWVLTGRTLVVAGVGKSEESLKWLAATFQITALDQPVETRVWSRPKTSGSFLEDLESYYRANWRAMMGQPPQPPSENPLFDTPAEIRFFTARTGAGIVVAAEDDDPFQEPEQLWSIVGQVAPPISFVLRHGFVPGTGETLGGSGLAIPGVGTPPVRGFLVMITLFVALVGPINYIALWRWRKLHLTLVTIPAAAALVTLAIIAYALLAEGSAVRGRVRAVTRILADGTAVTWSRQSYFAGVAASNGLRFSEAALVIPLPGEGATAQPAGGELLWRDGQAWRGGYYRSRRLISMEVVEVDRYPIRLGFDGRQARNDLGAHIQQLFVRDSEGKWWRASDIAAGQQAVLEPAKVEEVTRRLTLAATKTVDVSFTRRAARATVYVYDPWLAFARSKGIQPLADHMINVTTSLEALPPKPFIALVDQPSWFPMGTRPVLERESLRMVVGSWQPLHDQQAPAGSSEKSRAH
ncbi:MAG: hypothetical protein KatS3mg110_0130 [Pirellulaceae bacterium]|nr:MAG: hypothetical protein KatS3mg110_0130 [Pirellulaceae bacterium]